ncbi:MAG: hypothetical protein C4519_11220 [Desulfobacteraceae bacterium]|nr:MAG: hypothetical protein C4519_11220 [Desulfobacteraceae bacterium]
MNVAEWIVLGGVLFYLLTCWAIFDIARKDFGGIEKKAAWAFVALIPFIGPVIYMGAGARKGKKKPGASGG